MTWVKKNRWLIYILIGIVFGIIDFHYQELIHSIDVSSHTLLDVMILGFWLVPVVPIAIYEARIIGSWWRTALAAAVTWSVAIVAYYLFMMVKLVLIGEPGRPGLHISNHTDPWYWENFKSIMLGDILGGIGEWILVAIVGGLVVGTLVWITIRAIKSRRK